MATTWIEERYRLNLGRELMLVEPRPRPRLLMITALGHAFAADLIDVYLEAGSALAHNDLEVAVRQLCYLQWIDPGPSSFRHRLLSHSSRRRFQ